MGGDDVFVAFRNSLFDGRLAKKTLTLQETSYMRSVVHSMGYLAVRSDLAKDFLIQAANARFWETNLMWKSEYGVQIFGVMAGTALLALGISGCPEFGSISEGVIGDVNLRGILAGAVVDAFFHKHLVETRGWKGYRDMRVLFCGMDDFKDAFTAWRKTIEGSKWMNWFLDKSGLRTIYYLDGGELKRQDAVEGFHSKPAPWNGTGTGNMWKLFAEYSRPSSSSIADNISQTP